jgi:hypothetical protein
MCFFLLLFPHASIPSLHSMPARQRNELTPLPAKQTTVPTTRSRAARAVKRPRHRRPKTSPCMRPSPPFLLHPFLSSFLLLWATISAARQTRLLCARAPCSRARQLWLDCLRLFLESEEMITVTVDVQTRTSTQICPLPRVSSIRSWTFRRHGCRLSPFVEDAQLGTA